jgi:hypothetical protein
VATSTGFDPQCHPLSDRRPCFLIQTFFIAFFYLILSKLIWMKVASIVIISK